RKWALGPELGRGAFGQVHMGLDQVTGEFIAVKACLISGGRSSTASKLSNEIRLMQRCRHVNIVQYLGTELSPAGVYIVQEWVPGGSITSILSNFGAFTQPVTQCYARQILHGLVYLHSCGTVHRDLKGDNVLVSAGGIVKIADFGTSEQLYDLQDDRGHLQGTLHFMAPEVLQRQPQGMAVDVWAFACLVLQMHTGNMPWASELGARKRLPRLLRLMQAHRMPPLPNDLNPTMRAALTACFSWNPAERPTAKHLVHHGY
ncbi:kinase-like domain-containing protein, partial [Tribonema minus]